ncbi:putative transcription regulator domain protein [Ralstonia insidiosa]|uniref:Transcription regulator domain protein n=1 Tax=Ralstonia insidiosa TaxID=190721 RepID=A0AAC9FPC7_9RALS|nr:putative transcription regulator domain protein [Ralstonia insidiosa]
MVCAWRVHAGMVICLKTGGNRHPTNSLFNYANDGLERLGHVLHRGHPWQLHACS